MLMHHGCYKGGRMNKKLARLVVVVLLVTVSHVAYAEREITEADIQDVIEILKYVNTAMNETYMQFTGAFNMVASDCATEKTSDLTYLELTAAANQIEEELPNNTILLAAVKSTTSPLFNPLGSKYRPKFNNEKLVRKNISLFLVNLQQSYVQRQYGRCSYLVDRLFESKSVKTMVAKR